MLKNQQWGTCDQPEALVLIKVLPLCQINTDDLVAFGLLSASFGVPIDEGDEVLFGLPAQRAVVMSCPEALAFIKGVDYVVH